ncbi:hypothetical protein I9X13_04240 [Campylobacter jejuni]|nr:hypothetical protein [Campylobacter jejuni]
MKCFNAKFMFVGILAVFLSACSSGIPKCSDQDVQNVLTEIILEHNFGRFVGGKIKCNHRKIK